ncbi:MAG: hypothetical protein U9Q89_05335 [Thermodesulfobacteriota bacterium]|nr:hypothetical protein [Thermodesulfobacteriota bacterium]
MKKKDEHMDEDARDRWMKRMTMHSAMKELVNFLVYRDNRTKQEYDKIVLYLKTVGDKNLKNEYLIGKKNSADFDYDRTIEKMVKEATLRPLLIMCLNERKHFVITAMEALTDANDNTCSYKKALESVFTTANTMFLAVKEELGKLEEKK